MSWSTAATRRRLTLGSRDDTTGWYNKAYSEQPIDIVLLPKSARVLALSVGVHIRLDAVGLTADVVTLGDEIVTSNAEYYEVKGVREHYVADSFSHRTVDLVYLPYKNLTGESYTTATVEDARYRTKLYLETYLDADALPTFIVAYGYPDYPMTRVFNDKEVDLVFSIHDPTSTPLLDPHTRAPYGYDEQMTIFTHCIDKTNIEAVKLKQQARTEMRRVLEEYPTGSQRNLTRGEPADENLGSTIVYGEKYTWSYRRGTA